MFNVVLILSNKIQMHCLLQLLCDHCSKYLLQFMFKILCLTKYLNSYKSHGFI